MKKLTLTFLACLVFQLTQGIVAQELTSAEQAMKARIEAQLVAPGRHKYDAPKDPTRYPFEYFNFLGLEEAMVAGDLATGAGYSLEIISAAVGPDGRVHGQNSPQIMKAQKGYYDRVIKERFADNRLPNATHTVADIQSVAFPEKLDFVHWGLNLHDHANRDEAVAKAVLAHIRGILKPGGILGISDHIGEAGRDNSKLHRIELERAIALIEGAGFIIEGQSDLLRNDEEYSHFVYDEEIRHKTDRLLIRARNPG